MLQVVDCTLHYLVIDRQGERTIYVFLDDDPNRDGQSGPQAEPVVLELLPGTVRFRAARPVLGRSPAGPTRFREFRSEEELTAARYVPVPHFRVCDTWEDYHSPWGRPAADQDTERACDDDSL
jgi:hypothetical protein